MKELDRDTLVRDAVRQALSGLASVNRMYLRARGGSPPSTMVVPLQEIRERVEERLVGLRGRRGSWLLGVWARLTGYESYEPIYVEIPTVEELTHQVLPSLGLHVRDGCVEFPFELPPKRSIHES